MTKQECAIIQAYTGVCMLSDDDMDIFYSYLEYLYGYPVFIEMIPVLEEDIKRRAENDFLQICAMAFDVSDLFCDEDENTYKKNDSVDHPEHYQTSGGLETIDVIEAFTEGLKGIEAVCTGNILKYVCRWKKKNGYEDLKKAQWYLDKLIEAVNK